MAQHPHLIVPSASQPTRFTSPSSGPRDRMNLPPRDRAAHAQSLISREMWGRLSTPLMTRADYDAIGGVEGALANRAQAIFEDTTDQGKNEVAAALFRRLFTRLVNLGEGAEDTRRIVGRDELGPDAWALAQKLANEDNRLVVTAAATPGQETAEVVHEALIRNWPTLVDWVNRDRGFQTWLRGLKPRMDEWRANSSDEGTLLRGGPLAVAEEWRERHMGEITEDEHAYIAASLVLRERVNRLDREALELENARLAQIAAAQADTARLQRRARRTLIGSTTLVAALVVSGGLVVYQQHATNAAYAEENLAYAEEILAKRQELVDVVLRLEDALFLAKKRSANGEELFPPDYMNNTRVFSMASKQS